VEYTIVIQLYTTEHMCHYEYYSNDEDNGLGFQKLMMKSLVLSRTAKKKKFLPQYIH